MLTILCLTSFEFCPSHRFLGGGLLGRRTWLSRGRAAGTTGCKTHSSRHGISITDLTTAVLASSVSHSSLLNWTRQHPFSCPTTRWPGLRRPCQLACSVPRQTDCFPLSKPQFPHLQNAGSCHRPLAKEDLLSKCSVPGLCAKPSRVRPRSFAHHIVFEHFLWSRRGSGHETQK